MDNAAEQIKKIRALHLPVDELAACNRMAFFLGWAMKRGQMSNPLLSRHREVVQAVRAGKGPEDVYKRQGLYIALWSLLLVIPGIVKTYSYAMTPYIMSEHPSLTANEAITESRRCLLYTSRCV